MNVRRILATLVLVMQAGISLLGNAGLHAVPGHTCDHFHRNTPAEAVHVCTHHHGCSHSHAHDEKSKPAPAPIPHRHDDDCSICALFALTGTTPVVASVVRIEAPCIDAVPVMEPATWVTLLSCEPLPRGPPLG